MCKIQHASMIYNLYMKVAFLRNLSNNSIIKKTNLVFIINRV